MTRSHTCLLVARRTLCRPADTQPPFAPPLTADRADALLTEVWACQSPQDGGGGARVAVTHVARGAAAPLVGASGAVLLRVHLPGGTERPAELEMGHHEGGGGRPLGEQWSRCGRRDPGERLRPRRLMHHLRLVVPHRLPEHDTAATAEPGARPEHRPAIDNVVGTCDPQHRLFRLSQSLRASPVSLQGDDPVPSGYETPACASINRPTQAVITCRHSEPGDLGARFSGRRLAGPAPGSPPA